MTQDEKWKAVLAKHEPAMSELESQTHLIRKAEAIIVVDKQRLSDRAQAIQADLTEQCLAIYGAHKFNSPMTRSSNYRFIDFCTICGAEVEVSNAELAKLIANDEDE